MENEAAFYERALSRLHLLVLALGGAGTLIAWAVWGWRAGVGYLLGAGVAAVNFRWMHKAVQSLGAGKSPGKRMAVLLGLRYLALGAAGYVIVEVFGANLIALLIGLSVPVAAIVVEAVFELTYGRA